MKKLKRVWKKDGESSESYLKRLKRIYQASSDDNLLRNSLIKAFQEKEKEILAKRRSHNKIEAHQ